MRGGGTKDALSGERNKHLTIVAKYAVVQAPSGDERVRGLRLHDMPKGYTRPDGSKEPSGWEMFGDELSRDRVVVDPIALVTGPCFLVRRTRAERELVKQAAQRPAPRLHGRALRRRGVGAPARHGVMFINIYKP